MSLTKLIFDFIYAQTCKNVYPTMLPTPVVTVYNKNVFRWSKDNFSSFCIWLVLRSSVVQNIFKWIRSAVKKRTKTFDMQQVCGSGIIVFTVFSGDLFTHIENSSNLDQIINFYNTLCCDLSTLIILCFVFSQKLSFMI